ncbi:ABC transporter ATP-binding protein [Pseudochelatococcus lubricantis]|uniref:ABC transporter ATP-binding protein n=1 Tax=Pseudochelatococcus lubricantis TaxID=1538102 RepID=UPI0035F048FC
MSAELRIRNLQKRFGATNLRPAVDDVSFTIAPGEIVVLLGPSGCGKTTTLRSVAGLEKPTGGTIDIGGERVADPVNKRFVLPQHRNLGMVFQSYAVWPHMTVEQNVAYPLRHRRIGKEQTKRKVDEAIEIVGLGAYRERPVVALSGGQMQRVALARSLVYRPRILLLDEPLSNLDAKLRLRLRDDLRTIIKDAGVTALYVTHDQSEAVVIADRIGVMKDGKLLQLDDAITLYNSPADVFVANFTGAGTLLAGRVERVAHGMALVQLDDVPYSVRTRVPDDTAPGDRVLVSVRPENVHLETERREDGEMAGIVKSLQYEGTQTAYRIMVGDKEVHCTELGTRPRFAPGDTLFVWIPPEVCWAFHARAGTATSH